MTTKNIARSTDLLKSLLLSSFVASFAFVIVASSAGAQEEDSDVEALLRSTDDIELRITVKTDIVTGQIIQEAEVCPTSGCWVFELRGDDEDLTTLLDFVFVYAIYASGWGDFRFIPASGILPLPFILRNYTKGPALLDKYGGNCPVGSELERARCVIEDMYQDHQVGFYGSRRDEGVRSLAPYPEIFARSVTAESIQRQRQWIESTLSKSAQ